MFGRVSESTERSDFGLETSCVAAARSDDVENMADIVVFVVFGLG